jgi:predicted transcriptional regulator
MKIVSYRDLAEKLAPLLDALSHPARLEIMLFLAKHKNCPAGEITNHLPLSQSTVSQHMTKLRKVGLISCNTKGNCYNYCITDEGIDLLKVNFNEFVFRIQN